MFEKATRLKLRFDFKGTCTVEDLWDLPLEELDTIFKKLMVEIKAKDEESLLNIQSRDTEKLSLQIEIIKHIVKVRQEENQRALAEKDRADNKQKLMRLIAEKKEDNLRSLSVAKLEELLQNY
jgi:hypothetical protein